MGKNYGLPYMGSKNFIAEWVVAHIPQADTLVDLFAGGCAVTDCAMHTKKWRNFIVNDISDAPRLFADAVAGRYANERRWISREDFARLKDTNPYVRICWSFGNNQSNYMYSREVEPWKKALHYARVLGDYSLLREFGIHTDNADRQSVTRHHSEWKELYTRWYCSEVLLSDVDTERLRLHLTETIKANSEQLRAYLLAALKDSGLTQSEVQKRLGTQMAGHYFGRSQWEFPTREMYERMQTFMPKLSQPYDEVYGLQELCESLQRLQSLQRLERLQSLQSLQSLQRLQSLQKSYDEVEIPQNCVIYCDPPYKGTAGYNVEFDHQRFYDWIKRQTVPVIISEYDMPSEFPVIAERPHRSRLSATSNNFVMERLYGWNIPSRPKHFQFSLF